MVEKTIGFRMNVVVKKRKSIYNWTCKMCSKGLHRR